MILIQRNQNSSVYTQKFVIKVFNNRRGEKRIAELKKNNKKTQIDNNKIKTRRKMRIKLNEGMQVS